jgi:outer membrane protein insertion porin family
MIEGRKYYMGNVHFTGNEVLGDAVLNYAFRLDTVEVFDQYTYDASRKAIMDSYR